MVLRTLILQQPTYMIPLKWVLLIDIKPCYQKNYREYFCDTDGLMPILNTR